MKKKFLSIVLALSMLMSLVTFPSAVLAGAEEAVLPDSVTLTRIGETNQYTLSWQYEPTNFSTGANGCTFGVYTPNFEDGIDGANPYNNETVDVNGVTGPVARYNYGIGEETATSCTLTIPQTVYQSGVKTLYIVYRTEMVTDPAVGTNVYDIDTNGNLSPHVDKGTVNLNANGGTVDPGSKQIEAKTYADSAALTAAINVTPTKAGFKFKGWTGNSDGTTAAGLEVPVYNNDTPNPVTAYAMWEAKTDLQVSDFTVSGAVDYNGSGQAPTVTGPTGCGAITIKKYQPSAAGAAAITGATATDAETYTITIDVAESENYVGKTDLVLTGKTWTINKVSKAVVWSDKTKTYNGQAQAPTATIAKVPSGNMAASDFELQYKSGTDADFAAANGHTNAGTYSVKAVLGTDAAKNYTLTDDTIADFVINKAAPTKLNLDTAFTTALNAVKFDTQGKATLPEITNATVTGVNNETVAAADYDLSYVVTDADLNPTTREITLQSGKTSASVKVKAEVKATSTNYKDSVESTPVTVSSKKNITATVTVAANPAGAITEGNNVVLTATPSITDPATGTTPAYKWYKQAGAAPAAGDAEVTTGVDGNKLTLSNVQLANKDDKYYCVMTVTTANADYTSPKEVTSNTYTLDVTNKPADPDVEATVAITADPGTTVKEGTPITLTATPTITKPATGATPTYQWKKNGANIAGATNPTYTIDDPVTGDVYTCEVTVSAANFTTKTFTPENPITVTANPEVKYNVTAKTPTNGTYKYKVGDEGTEVEVTTADSTASNIEAGTTVTVTETTPASGYRYSSMSVVDAAGKKVTVNSKTKSFVMPESDVTVTVNFARSGGGGGGSSVSSYTVKYNVGDNGKITEGKASESVVKNASPKAVPTVTANEGYKFVGWSLDGETTVDPTAQKITKSTTFTALYEEEAAPTPTPTPTAKPDTNSHKEYIYGYEDGDFRPENGITRAETAAIFARALTEYSEDTTYESAGFTDLDGTEWFINNVNYLANTGVITGYEDGTFRPYESISRQEFATMITRLGEVLEAGDMPFSDVSEENWGIDYIYTAYTNGLVTGYEDGTFRPENSITRAEAVTIVNGYLGREVDAEGLADATYTTFPDVTTSHWAYFEVIEAANAHDFVVDSKPEDWVD